MNPLVKKEIRLLLPAFGICCALALPNLFFRFNSDGSLQNWWCFMLSFVLCGATTVMLALNSFGGEFSSGTFSNLLAQPVSRQKIWESKISVLAASLLIVGIFWSACGLVRLAMLGRDLGLLDLFATVGTFGLVVFSGGLWTVLLVRHVAAAFWFTVLVPGVILVILAGLLAGESGEFTEGMVVSVLGIYSLAGFFFARWLFFRAQDTQWTGGTISLPEVRGLGRFRSVSGARRTWRPHTALFVKELQLHQAQFVIAGALMLLHVGVIATRHLAHVQRNSALELIRESFWALWLVMPVLVGCTAVAEERKIGTLESQLCLPARRRTQFEIKLFVALSLSILFGTIMPLLFEGERILPDVHFWTREGVDAVTPYSFWVGHMSSSVWMTLVLTLRSLDPFMPFLFLAGISAGIGALSVYASTQARNTLQAIGPAVLGILLAIFLSVSAYVPEQFVNYPLWRGWLIYLIGVPVLLVVLAALAYWNYQRVLVGWNVWRRNLLTFAFSLALVMTATTALYHRVWELLSPLEPPHGPARLTPLHPPKLRCAYGDITAVLSDGRGWVNRYTTLGPNQFPDKIIFSAGRFLDGTNWAEVSDGGQDIIGIQRDGSLWVSKTPEPPVHWDYGLGQIAPLGSTELVRVGNDHDWKSVAGLFRSVFLLKTDGSLWFYGTNDWRGKTEWPGLHAFELQRLGTNSDWTEIFEADYRTFFRNTSGQVWVYPSASDYDVKLRLDHHIVLGRAVYSETNQWRNLVWSLPTHGYSFQLGVCTDGTLRELAAWQPLPAPAHSPSFSIELVANYAQIGTETNWLAVAGNGNVTIALKADGSLWRWTFATDPAHNPKAASAVRLGTHSDWIAISQVENGVVSLAEDGSLWWWRFDPQRYFPSEGTPPLLMARRPELLGNIFGKAD